MQSKDNPDSDEEKTEEPTEERRRRMREEGNLPNPKDVVGSFTLILFFLFFYFYGRNFLFSFRESFQRTFHGVFDQSLTAFSLLPTILYVLKPIVPFLLLIFSVTLLLPLMFGLTLTRFNFAVKKLAFDWNKLNPVNGLNRMFGKQSVIEYIKVIVKFSILVTVSYFAIKNEILDANKNYFFQDKIIVVECLKSIGRLCVYLCGGTMFIAGLDYGYNLWKFEQDLKMTKKELKEDIKQQEGDPMYKSRRKRMARDLVLKKSIQEVPKATFIVTNPEHFSVAVKYSKGMRAPIIVAKGQDYLALKIREIAKKNDIMIVENKPLARTLYKTVKVGQEIPQSLYQAVIEVMTYIYRFRGKNYFEQRSLLEMQMN